jgi:hypothetical protein
MSGELLKIWFVSGHADSEAASQKMCVLGSLSHVVYRRTRWNFAIKHGGDFLGKSLHLDLLH